MNLYPKRATTPVPLDVLDAAVRALDAAKDDPLASIKVRSYAADAAGRLESYLREAQREAV